jgi:hypothetical protein
LSTSAKEEEELQRVSPTPALAVTSVKVPSPLFRKSRLGPPKVVT